MMEGEKPGKPQEISENISEKLLTNLENSI